MWRTSFPFLKRVCATYVFFFFSSRRRHTRCSRDWSSDVCSSDLNYFKMFGVRAFGGRLLAPPDDSQSAPRVAVMSYHTWLQHFGLDPSAIGSTRSEERRVGKECRSRWSPYH